MLLVVAVVVGAILVGLALGGSLRNLADARLRWWLLALLGLVLQVIPVPSRPGQADHWLAVGLMIGSYVFLLAFVAANLRLPGFPLVAVGFALNLLVIGANGGMPVKDEALRDAAGSRYPKARQELLQKGGLMHHLAGPGDVLLPLSDVVGIGPPVRSVFSPGDLASYAGAGWAVAALTRRPMGKHRRGAARVGVRQERAGDPAGLDRNRDGSGLERRSIESAGADRARPRP
jgi:hypothetical protein